MIVRLIWPASMGQPSFWRNEPTDFFWVECLSSEAEAKVISHINIEGMETIDQLRVHLDEKHPYLCFLVSRDMHTVQPMPWYYPYSGLWNAYCPFRRMDEEIIDDLSQLAALRATWEGKEY